MESFRFRVEDNGCPATGLAWEAFRKEMEECDAENTCWGCGLHGENKIVGWREV